MSLLFENSTPKRERDIIMRFLAMKEMAIWFERLQSTMTNFDHDRLLLSIISNSIDRSLWYKRHDQRMLKLNSNHSTQNTFGISWEFIWIGKQWLANWVAHLFVAVACCKIRIIVWCNDDDRKWLMWTVCMSSQAKNVADRWHLQLLRNTLNCKMESNFRLEFNEETIEILLEEKKQYFQSISLLHS